MQSDQLCSIGAAMTSSTSLSLSIYILLLYGVRTVNTVVHTVQYIYSTCVLTSMTFILIYKGSMSELAQMASTMQATIAEALFLDVSVESHDPQTGV